MPINEMERKVSSMLQEWRTFEAKAEEKVIRQYIENKIADRFAFKAIKKGALSELIPIDIEGRQYLVSIARKSIEICVDEDKYLYYLAYNHSERQTGEYLHSKRYEFYRNYSQQYKDFGLILDAVDNYLDSKTSPEWNTVERIEEAIRFVEDFRKKYLQKFGSDDYFYCISDYSSDKKQIESHSFKFFLKRMELYRDILRSTDDIYVSYLYRALKEFPLNNLYSFQGVADFLKNFEINRDLLLFELNKSISAKTNDNEFALSKYNYKGVDYQNEYIMNTLKQINMELYNKIYKEEQSEKTVSKRQYEHKYDCKLHDLFYNDTFFKFLLPEEISLNGDRIFVQVLNISQPYVFTNEPFQFFFIPHSNKNHMIFKINSGAFLYNRYDEIELCEVNFSGKERYLQGYLRDVRGIFVAFREDQKLLNKVLQTRALLIELIKNNKELIIKHILVELKKHLKKVRENDIQLDNKGGSINIIDKGEIDSDNIDKEGKRLILERYIRENKSQDSNSLYNLFYYDYLVDSMDKYLSNQPWQ